MLKTVLDTEVRALIQQIAVDISAKYKLDDLRDKKVEISEGVRKGVITFFQTRGITITTVGMFGGMTYKNPEIQKAIDKTFIAQQEKVISVAELAAQTDKNKRIEIEAEALASAAEKQTRGVANGNLLKAEAEAKGILVVNEAIAKSAQIESMIRLKEIEVKLTHETRWEGKYPSVLAGEGANTWIGLGSINEKDSSTHVKKMVTVE